MRVNNKLSAWLQLESPEARRLKGARTEDSSATSSPTIPTKANGAEEGDATTKGRGLDSLDSFLDGAESLSSDELSQRAAQASTTLAGKLKDATGEEVQATFSELKVREAALRQALQANQSLVSQGTLDFLQ